MKAWQVRRLCQKTSPENMPTLTNAGSNYALKTCPTLVTLVRRSEKSFQ
jgi:hypothetical protein